jgi:hypothetical protein
MTMKNINKISIFLLALVFLFSCEEKLQTLDSGSFFVRFQTASVNLIEGTSTLKIPVTLGSPAQSTATEIQYEISGNAVEGVDYSFASTKGSLSIPAGSFADTIRLNILDDLETDGAKDLILTLTSVSNGLNPGIGTLGKLVKVSIADNDCPFDAAEYVGAYSLTMELANGFIFAAGTYDIDASLVLGTEANTLVDPDFGYLSASGRTPVPVAIKINPTGPTTVTLGSDFTFGDGSSVTDAVFAYGTTPNRRFFTGDGFGVLSSCAKSFTVKALIRREDGTTGQILTLTYTKK